MALHQPSAALHLLVALLGLADPTVYRMLRLQRVASGNHVLLLLLPRRRRRRLVLDLWLEGQKANLRAFSVADPALLRSRRAKGRCKAWGRRTSMESSACSSSGAFPFRCVVCTPGDRWFTLHDLSASPVADFAVCKVQRRRRQADGIR